MRPARRFCAGLVWGERFELDGDDDPEQFPHPAKLRKDQQDRRDSKPDRHPEAQLRQVPAGRRPAREAGRHGPPGGLQVRLSHQGLQRDQLARVRELPPREAQVRRGRVPPAGHDLLRPDQGGRPPGRLGQGRGDGRPVDPRRQGAGGLLRRDPAHDGERDLHHQRDGAGGRLPAPPLARRLLRPRQGQEPLLRQAALQRPHHPVPRLLDRLRVRPQGHPLRAHRPAPEAAGHGAAARPGRRARHLQEGAGRVPRHRRGDPQVLLRHRDHPHRGQGQVREGPEPRPAQGPARHPRHPRPQVERGDRQEEPEVHRERHQEAGGGQAQVAAGRPGGGLHQDLRRGRGRRGDRRGPPRGERGGHRGQDRGAAQARTSTRSRCSSSTT